MPRASINLEFTDDDLRKFIEDGLRRWTLNTIHDLLKHIRDPHLSDLIKQAIHMGMSAGVRVGRQHEGEAPPHQRPFDVGEIFTGDRHGSPHDVRRGPPYGVPPGELKRCMPVEANPYQEEGWMCHECSTYNGMQRSVCRQCDHERCDDVVPPPPSPGGGNVPSGSA